jgi:hypothetical protein
MDGRVEHGHDGRQAAQFVHVSLSDPNPVRGQTFSTSLPRLPPV